MIGFRASGFMMYRAWALRALECGGLNITPQGNQNGLKDYGVLTVEVLTEHAYLVRSVEGTT